MSSPKQVVKDVVGGVENTVKGVSRAANDLTGGGVQGTIDTLTGVAKGFENAVGGAGKNIERNMQTKFNDLGTILSGDFNNAGNSILRNFMTNTFLAAANPDDLKKITGQTGSERKAGEMQQQARNDAANLAGARQSEIDEMVKAVITGQVSARARAPGSAQTFINAPKKQNTLLTLKGS